MNLATEYLGLTLKNPLMPGASPLVDDLSTVRRLEDAGAAAIVMHSLFEEQLELEHTALERDVESHNESFAGPSLIIAYSHCIAHGYALSRGLEQQKLAVDSGVWPLYRFDPRRTAEGKVPLQLDSAAPKIRVGEYLRNELRFKMKPEKVAAFEAAAQEQVDARFALYQKLAADGTAK